MKDTKIMTRGFRIAMVGIVFLCGLSQMVSAAPQYKGGVPSMNVNANQKRTTESNNKAYENKRKAHAAAAAYRQQSQQNQQGLAVTPSSVLPQMSFRRQSITPTYPAGSSFETQPTPSVNGHVLSYFSSEKGRQTATTSAMSGGVAASGLMTTGSRYSSSATEGGGSATVSASAAAPSGPRKIPDHPEEWWLTPVGDAALPLVLLALAYAAFIALRRKKVA